MIKYLLIIIILFLISNVANATEYSTETYYLDTVNDTVELDNPKDVSKIEWSFHVESTTYSNSMSGRFIDISAEESCWLEFHKATNSSNIRIRNQLGQTVDGFYQAPHTFIGYTEIEEGVFNEEFQREPENIEKIVISGVQDTYGEIETAKITVHWGEEPEPYPKVNYSIVGEGTHNITAKVNDETEINSGDEVEPGSDVYFYGELEEGYMVTDWYVNEQSQEVMNEEFQIYDVQDDMDIEMHVMSTDGTEPYNIVITKTGHNKIGESSWLQVLIDERFPPNVNWRYRFYGHAEKEDGSLLEGRMVPVPSTRYLLRKWKWQIPPRALVSIDETDHFQITSKETTMDFYGPSDVEDMAPDCVYMAFYPHNKLYPPTIICVSLRDRREEAGHSHDPTHSDWDERPYFVDHEYGEETFHITDDRFKEDMDAKEPEDITQSWLDTQEDLHDTYVDKKIPYTDLIFAERMDEFMELLKSRAPFGYIMPIYEEVQMLPDKMGTDDLNVNLPASDMDGIESDVSINLTHGDFNDLFSFIRTMSKWVFYFIIPYYFYCKYRELVGFPVQGGGGAAPRDFDTVA